MPLFLEVYRNLGERLDVWVEAAGRKIGRLSCRRSGLLCLDAYLLQCPMVDASVDKPITAGCPLRDPDEFVGDPRQRKMKQAIILVSRKTTKPTGSFRLERREYDSL
jgi:hypothetical protein